MIIVASIRPKRAGGPAGEWIAGIAREHPGFNVTVADLREIDLPLMTEPNHPRLRQYTQEHTKRWSRLVDAQDAYVIVFPEYNHGVSAPLKNAIDYLMQEWAHKPVGLVSYGGISGGLRATQQLKTILSCLRMVPLTDAVVLSGIGDRIVDGRLDPGQPAIEAAEGMLASLWGWSLALRPLRNGEIPDPPTTPELAAAVASHA